MPSDDRDQRMAEHGIGNDQSNNLQTIDLMIQQKMAEMFTEQFENLKDQVVTVMANKMSSLIEDNNNLRIEIKQLRETSETEKKELTVVHQLVTTFNTKLSDVQREHGVVTLFPR